MNELIVLMEDRYSVISEIFLHILYSSVVGEAWTFLHVPFMRATLPLMSSYRVG